MGLEERVFIALGSNLGDKSACLFGALQKLREIAKVIATSFLYKTSPMYVENQPSFYNAVCEIRTEREPLDLLHQLQDIESSFGRVRRGERYGPRSLDLDVLIFGNRIINTEELIVPHPRLAERDFVLFPLRDIDRNLPLATGETVEQACERVSAVAKDMKRLCPRRVVSCGNKEFLWGEKTYTMGILNVTPDSFSDGGKYQSVENALQRAMEMIDVDIVDIGGQSTRPGIEYISVEEEKSRVIPVIKAIRENLPNVIISIDTFRHEVAQAAVENGAHIVNDVSCGLLDEKMFDTVHSLGVPYMAMHMRGTSKTMMQFTEYSSYPSVVLGVATELERRIDVLLKQGFPRWLLIVDPGIGFAKSFGQNVELIRNLGEFKSRLSDMPVLVGVSRKGFIAKIADCASTEDGSDWATAGAVTAAIAFGADIVRFHRPELIHTVKVADELFRKVQRLS
ncbi:Folic acid synthesis protein fol1 [Galdieria sulphuraria]|uniref:Dihydropteroate synthase n=1 Tax=Galdieria sulphuraria TaxID=130081 RepID=M2XB96_GALSU|nr:dihydropteroate synthase [Galdieria sulphuraria]EME27177.1 dihydropteroate synthase [Galdieria sulphuraria]GJD09337.1 Folic acid synthesis protein fol1 [Galdieria sulphuraria]|eukprot:XP_005703697.1 dihydropteroate synthase [Galdieria sulphuraria]